MDYPKSVPSVGLVNGRFVDEDPGAGTPGSLIPSAWGNAVTEEILAVISDAGLVPDEENNGQLKEALIRRDASATATQAEAEAGIDNAKRMTPLRVFQAIAKAVKQSTETTFGWAKVATQAQTNAGTDDSTIVSPKKLSAWFSTVVAQATEAVAGLAKIATQAQTNAGTDDATVVTPKKLKTGVAYSLGTSGYIGLPSWLGGFMVQWGRVSGAAGAVVQAFPTSFSSNCYGVVGGPILGTLNRVESLNVSAVAAMNFTCSRSYSAGGTAAGSATEHFYLAWGV